MSAEPALSTKARLGFIGLGAMGGRMARNLLRAGYRVTVYDVRPEAVAACAQAGGEPAADAAEVAWRSDVVMTSLVSHVYLQVAQEALVPNARNGQIFIDHSTIPAPKARRLAEAFAKREAASLDVPVSGWITGAESGTLSMFVGGDEKAARACWPIFEVLGDSQRILYGGEAGMGQVLKVLQQLKTRLVDAARLEVLAFGLRSGVTMDLALRTLDVAPKSDDPYAKLSRRIERGEGDDLGLLYGEWPYYLEQARDRGFPMPVLESLYAFCSSGDHVNHDEQGRPGPSVWRELMTRPGSAYPGRDGDGDRGRERGDNGG